MKQLIVHRPQSIVHRQKTESRRLWTVDRGLWTVLLLLSLTSALYAADNEGSSSAEAELAKAKNMLRQSFDRNKELVEQNKAYEDKVMKLLGDIEVKEEEMKRMSTKLASSLETSESVRSEADEIKDKAAQSVQLTSQVSELQEKLKLLQLEFTRLDQEKTGLQKQMEEKDAKAQADSLEFKTKMEESEASHQYEMGKLKTELKSSAELAVKMEELQKEFEDLTLGRDKLALTNKDLEAQLETAARRYEGLEKDSLKVENDRESHKKTLETLLEQVKQAQTKAEEDRTKLQGELERVEKEKEQMHTELLELNEKMQEIENKNNGNQVEISREELSKMTEEIKSLKAEGEIYQKEKEKLTKENSEAMKALKIQLENDQKENAKLSRENLEGAKVIKEKVESYRKENEKLTQENLELSRTANQAEVLKSRRMIEKEAGERSHKEVRQSLDSLQDDLARARLDLVTKNKESEINQFSQMTLDVKFLALQSQLDQKTSELEKARKHYTARLQKMGQEGLDLQKELERIQKLYVDAEAAQAISEAKIAAFEKNRDEHLKEIEVLHKKLRRKGVEAGTWQESKKVSKLEKKLDKSETVRKNEKITYLYNMGIFFARQGNFKAAVDAYEKVLAVDPKDVSSHYNLGILYEDHMDNPNKAILHYDAFCALSTDHGKIRQVESWVQKIRDQGMSGGRESRVQSSRHAIEELLFTSSYT